MRLAGKAALALCGALLCAATHALDVRDATADVRTTVAWITAQRDHGGRHFAVVDKRAAVLWLFDGRGRPVASSPVLLGSARGDRSAPDVGRRTPADLAPHERTTPAGRFISEPGRNLDGEHVIWFDYDAGLAIHRLRPGASHSPRQSRLASGAADDNRVSLGCVVVPEAFYDGAVRPLLGAGRGTVYVLPEDTPLARWLEARPD